MAAHGQPGVRVSPVGAQGCTTFEYFLWTAAGTYWRLANHRIVPYICYNHARTIIAYMQHE